MTKLSSNKKYQYFGVSPQRIRIKKNNFWGVKDKSGKIILQPKFEEIFSLSTGYGLIAAKNNENWNIFNSRGIPISTEHYKTIYPYYGIFGITKVQKGNNWGIIDKFGNLIFPIAYKSIKVFGKGLILKNYDNSVEFIDREVIGKITFEQYQNN